MNIDECSSTISTSAGELHPSLISNLNRGHSRQASKSSMCSNYSTTSANSTNNSIHPEKTHLRFVYCILHDTSKKRKIFIRHVLNESRHFHNSHSDPNMLSNVR